MASCYELLRNFPTQKITKRAIWKESCVTYMMTEDVLLKLYYNRPFVPNERFLKDDRYLLSHTGDAVTEVSGQRENMEPLEADHFSILETRTHVVDARGDPERLQRYQLLAGIHGPPLQCPETVKTKVLDRTNV